MSTPKNPDRLWPLANVKDFVKRAKDRVGEPGWRYLSHDMREALIAQQALNIVIGNARHDIPGAAVQQLYADMRQAAGLNDE